MEAYIAASNAISPQESSRETYFDGGYLAPQSARLKCVEPDYKEVINPSLIRRMSRIVKMGVASGIRCLKEAGIEKPDAIITGTGLGCMEDTGNFLVSIMENKEQFLTPTAFIQSTHNTISGQIALMIKCNNYNFAYVHKGFSFESALLDAMMMLQSQEAETILLGGIDEITDDYFNITSRLGMWKRGFEAGNALFQDHKPGTVAGEGAAFFLLKKSAEAALARFRGVDMIFEPEKPGMLTERASQLLEKNGLGINDVDAIMLGVNGWPAYDLQYQPVEDQFAGKPVLTFKNLCGEYMTASAFGAWLAAGILHHQKLPEGCLLRGNAPKAFKNILVHNHFMGKNHTLMLLSAC